MDNCSGQFASEVVQHAKAGDIKQTINIDEDLQTAWAASI